jgi:hypothetical protein
MAEHAELANALSFVPLVLSVVLLFLLSVALT